MNTNGSMTGTFQVPSDLLSALKASPVEDPGKGMEVRSMKPSLMDRLWALFSRSPRGRR
ncbi:MAG TPA: hypothetical protein VJ764_00310 [Steroidobacteraceae bacterium]|nr:hypothetical protein [Steroidobacteraceae bacterium]